MPFHYWRSDRLTLRALQSSDIVLFQALDDEVNRKVDMIHFPQSPEKQIQWLEAEQRNRMGDAFRWVAETSDGELLGTINTFLCNKRYGTFKYGIALLPEHRSKGYASEMIRTVLRFYFHEMNYHKATPHVYSFNTASIRLHEKLGFVQEGRLRDMIYTNGEYHDELHFGMTASEFGQLYGKPEL
ncbi:GNAT family N-acetyltransferase [Paenibacillus sp. PAMC21692]|uniref:GNAT family N-acetyltransferase n=1 Tax=Paenibacillus sp. PAMC21692 TaxID=2762320 RepID=UPI00164DBCB3|nr:GNAT family protein [Paenibacillus sp. PAMC21692]QNK57532.1 GNAT family N-acetyltransferase [Paenibacillus sp. PAMC21692]